MENLVESYGLGLLFLLIMLESAGIPLPGETALIGAAVLAERGHFDIVDVAIVAAVAAIVGDNGGYWIGRIWGRKILGRWAWLERLSARSHAFANRSAQTRGVRAFVLRWIARLLALALRAALAFNRFLARTSARIIPPSERFFARHGGKTVFFGRFIALLRITSAWLAGVSRMPWWQFLFWNAAGGILWATLVSLLAFYVGKAAAEAFNQYGLIGAGVIVGVVVIAVGLLHFWRKRIVPEDVPAEDG